MQIWNLPKQRFSSWQKIWSPVGVVDISALSLVSSWKRCVMGACLQNWIDCNNDSGLNKIIVFPSKQHFGWIFSHFYFFPLFLLVLWNMAILNCTKSVPGFLPPFHCCFCPFPDDVFLLLIPDVVFLLLILFQLQLDSSIKTMGVLMTGSAQVVNSVPTALQYKDKGTENGAERQKRFWRSMNVSQLFWIFWASSVLFIFFNCIIVHTLIWKCLLQTLRSLTEMKLMFFPGAKIWSHYRNKNHQLYIEQKNQSK